MLIISGNEIELKIINDIITDFNEHSVQYEMDDGRTYIQSKNGMEIEYKFIVENKGECK